MELLDIQGKIETAFERVLTPYHAAGDFSVWQLIRRFFTGRPQARRIAIVAENVEASFRAEDGAPLEWRAEVRVEIASNIKDDGEGHDDIVSRVAECLYGGAAFCAAANLAMDGEGFNALFWEADARRTSSKDGTSIKTVIVGTLEMQPWKN